MITTGGCNILRISESHESYDKGNPAVRSNLISNNVSLMYHLIMEDAQGQRPEDAEFDLCSNKGPTSSLIDTWVTL